MQLFPFKPNPAEITQAAPIFTIEALCLYSRLPVLMMLAMFWATTFPITPEGIPVRGAVAVIAVPFALTIGLK